PGGARCGRWRTKPSGRGRRRRSIWRLSNCAILVPSISTFPVKYLLSHDVLGVSGTTPFPDEENDAGRVPTSSKDGHTGTRMVRALLAQYLRTCLCDRASGTSLGRQHRTFRILSTFFNRK